ncbi:MAG: LysR substrate-binding domain-containing protein, partial [Aestuariivirgaceae bacterium]
RVELRLITGNSARLIESLERLEIDFAVVAELLPSDVFIATKIREDRLVCLLPGHHPLARRKSIRFSELTAGPLVLRERGSVTRALLEAEAGRRGLRLRQFIEIEGREGTNEAVAQGLGAGIISLGEFPRDPRLKSLSISDWQEHMCEWLVCLRARADLHMIRAFIDLLGPA